MAEGLLRKMAADAERNDLEVVSCGTSGGGHLDVPSAVKRVMEERGIDLSRHRSRPPVPEDLETVDLILVMEEVHRDFIRKNHPRCAGKTHLLKEYAGIGGEPEVGDPIGMSDAAYRACADELAECVRQVLARMTREGEVES